MFERRPQGQPRGPAPRRPLPLLPVVHDHLPERRRLHAPRRPRPRPHRGDRQAQLQGARDPRAAGGDRCPTPIASAWRCGRARFARPFAGAAAPARPQGAGRHARSGARRACCAAADFAGPGTAATKGERRKRVILLAGCAQQVLRPEINDATIRLLARRGVDVEVAPGAGCCGALVHHMGREAAAVAMAKRNVDAWTRADRQGRSGRCRHRQRVGLRHHRQGLRPHAEARAASMPSGPPRSPP